VIRALIADDEPLARARLRRLLGRERDVVIVAESADGRSVRAALERQPIDLAILDIEMPELDGLTAFRAVARAPLAIFVTAFEQYARHAFDAEAVDYVLKPVDPDRFAEALARVRRRIDEPPRLTFGARLGSRIRFVDALSIDWIEAQGNYVALHAAGVEELVRTTIGAIEGHLDPECFVRIHRRYIVRIDRIRDITTQPSGDFHITLNDGVRLPCGRKHRRRVAEVRRGALPNRR
jgi:two-component system LytT family response regulator